MTLLRLASDLATATLMARIADAGYPELRPAHARLLRFPGLDGFRPTELAERVGASKQALNPTLNELERWGYIERRPDGRDQRGRVIRLTDHGQALMAEIRRLHAELEAEWASELGSNRFETLRISLRQLLDAHGDAPPHGT